MHLSRSHHALSLCALPKVHHGPCFAGVTCAQEHEEVVSCGVRVGAASCSSCWTTLALLCRALWHLICITHELAQPANYHCSAASPMLTMLISLFWYLSQQVSGVYAGSSIYVAHPSHSASRPECARLANKAFGTLISTTVHLQASRRTQASSPASRRAPQRRSTALRKTGWPFLRATLSALPRSRACQSSRKGAPTGSRASSPTCWRLSATRRASHHTRLVRCWGTCEFWML